MALSNIPQEAEDQTEELLNQGVNTMNEFEKMLQERQQANDSVENASEISNNAEQAETVDPNANTEANAEANADPAANEVLDEVREGLQTVPNDVEEVPEQQELDQITILADRATSASDQYFAAVRAEVVALDATKAEVVDALVSDARQQAAAKRQIVTVLRESARAQAEATARVISVLTENEVRELPEGSESEDAEEANDAAAPVQQAPVNEQPARIIGDRPALIPDKFKQ